MVDMMEVEGWRTRVEGDGMTRGVSGKVLREGTARQ